MAAAVNNMKFISGINPDDPTYKKEMIRPAEIKEDVKLMEQRKRVSLILKSDAFKHELEDIIYGQVKDSDASAEMSRSWLSLEYISEQLLSAAMPNKNSNYQPITTSNGIVPINDLRGSLAALYTKQERTYRCKLAAVYRLLDMFNWNTGIFNHVTIRINRDREHFLIKPFGLMFHEVSAASLVKIDFQGKVVDPGSTVLGIDKKGWSLHAAIHWARPDIRCIIHLSTPAAVAVSCMKSGLLPLCRESIVLGTISTLDMSKIGANEAIGASISQAMGNKSKILLVRGCGLLICGETVEEMWHYTSNAQQACETQIRLAPLLNDPANLDELVNVPDDETKQRVMSEWKTSGISGSVGGREGVIKAVKGRKSGGGDPVGDGTTDKTMFRCGELEFEALMRHLDNAGYRTGYMSRLRDMAAVDKSRPKSPDQKHRSSRHGDVEVPPSCSSVAAAADQYDDVGSGDETEMHSAAILSSSRAENGGSQWFNTPNTYKREEYQIVSQLEEAPRSAPSTFNKMRKPHGSAPTTSEVTVKNRWITANPKELTSPVPVHPVTPGAHLNITAPPVLSSLAGPCEIDNPKEFKDNQKKVRARYYYDTTTAGPQSRLLDGLTWEEARRVRDDGLAKALGPGFVTDKPIIGAASKGIIQRMHRNDAVVYEGVYKSQNPFEKVTDDDLAQYKVDVERKRNPGQYPFSDDEIIRASSSKMESVAPDVYVHTAPPDDITLATDTETAQKSSSLAPGRAITFTSETSAAEISHTDTEGPEGKAKKKKRRFKLPSFSRKKKDKDGTQSSKE